MEWLLGLCFLGIVLAIGYDAYTRWRYDDPPEREPLPPSRNRVDLQTVIELETENRALHEELTKADSQELDACERLARWMIRQGLSTGHGESLKELLDELEEQRP